MIEKHIEGLNLTVKQAEPVSIKQPAGRISTLVIALCALAFVLCTLLSVAPLSRILDPVIQLQTPFGTQLAQVGAWLPTDIGLTPYRRASLAGTGYIEFLALIALAFAIYGLCALFIQRRAPAHNQPALRLIWLATIAAGLIYVFTPAMLSHDIFVYASYGRVLAVYHNNPYFAPLSAFPQDPFNALNYWANATAAYGPVWIYICSLWGFVLGPQALGYVLAFRLFALAMHLLNTWLVATTLRTSGQSSRVVLLGTLLYAWNPLVLMESSFGGHNDVFMVTLLLVGILLSIRAEKRGQFTHPRGYVPPLIAFTLAALIKFTTLPLIVLFIIFLTCRVLRPAQSPALPFRKAVMQRWRPALLTICIAIISGGLLALVLYAPFWIPHNFTGIQHTFTRTPSAQFAEDSILLAIFKWYEANNNQPDYLVLQVLSARWAWDTINTVVLAGFLLTGAFWLWRAPTIRTFILASLATLGGLLIITPWFFSWYITWLIGLVVVCLPLAHNRLGRSLLAFTLAFSISAFSTYLFKDGIPPFGIWIGWVPLTTIALPLLAFLITFLTWRPVKQTPLGVERIEVDI